MICRSIVISNVLHFFVRTQAHFSQNLRTISASAEEQSFNFSILDQIFAVNAMYKTEHVQRN